MLNIFVNTWGNYNENGADGGEWVTLPMDSEELAETMETIAKNMGDNDPEFCIHDYEWTTEIEPRDIGEMENIMELNEQLNELYSLKEWELKEIVAIMEATGDGFMEAMENRDNYTVYIGMDLEEVAEELINDCYFTKDTPDIFTRYFDYKAFARDLSFDGYTETKFGVVWGC